MKLQALDQLTQELSKLPTIGQKSAQRLAFHIVSNKDNLVNPLIKALNQLENIVVCQSCFGFSEQQPFCSICNDENRIKSQICVLEEAQNLIVIEESGIYRGMYHILGGVISPIHGKSPEKLKINQLISKINDNTNEVIIATNPTLEGEATAFYIKNKLRHLPVKITRIATGLPSGGEIEYSNLNTLKQAFHLRVNF